MDDGWTLLDRRLRGWVDERDLAGTVLLTRRGETVFQGCYGPADRSSGVPVTPRTRFETASVTKLFTAAAVAHLVEQGDLSFDRAVVDVLPAHRRPSTLRPDVTVAHLLTHTSGIADYCEEEDDHPAYVEDYGALWDDRPVSGMQRPADFLPMFGDLPPDRPPGVLCRYSNAGFVVLGLVVEEVTGSAYTDAVTQHVFDRAGMAHSAFLRHDEADQDAAVHYLPRSSPSHPWRSNVFRVPVVGGADGGACVTAADMCAFLDRVADGTLLGGRTDAVLSRQVEYEDGYAFGLGPLIYPDGRWGHGGGDPGVDALTAHFPAEHVDLVVLCSGEGLAGPVRDATLTTWRAVMGE